MIKRTIRKPEDRSVAVGARKGGGMGRGGDGEKRRHSARTEGGVAVNTRHMDSPHVYYSCM